MKRRRGNFDCCPTVKRKQSISTWPLSNVDSVMSSRCSSETSSSADIAPFSLVSGDSGQLSRFLTVLWHCHVATKAARGVNITKVFRWHNVDIYDNRVFGHVTLALFLQNRYQTAFPRVRLPRGLDKLRLTFAQVTWYPSHKSKHNKPCAW